MIARTTAKSSPRAGQGLPRLLRWFFICGVSSLLGILIVVGFGQWRVMRQLVVTDAIHDAESAARLAQNIQDRVLVKALVAPDAASEGAKSRAAFERRFRNLLDSLGVVRVLLYDFRGKPVYGSDPAFESLPPGRATGSSPKAGAMPHLETVERLTDLKGRSRERLEVLAVTLPVEQGEAQVGALTLVLDVSSQLAASRAALWQSMWRLALVLVITFGLLAAIMGRATGLLTAHARAIHETNDQLRAANERLERLATTDPLTGLLNRRGAMERFQEAWSSSERSATPLSCILIDVDHFKSINDEFGHSVGDDVLRRLATCLGRHRRANEVLGRVGGEEFLVICPMATAEQAAVGAERLRAAVEREFTDAAGRGTTISAGVAEKSPHLGHPDNLLMVADEALYSAKGDGRNRVGVAQVPLVGKGKLVG